MLICFFITSLIAGLLAIPLYDINIFTNPVSISEDPAIVATLKLIQIFNSIGFYLIPSLLIAFLISGRINEYLKLNKKGSTAAVLLTALIMFSSVPLMNFLIELNQKIHFPEFLKGLENIMKRAEENAAELTKLFLRTNSFQEFLLNFFMIALLPALGEELLFRGVLQKMFTQWTKSLHWGIWISAILFSTIHFQFYGFLPRMLMGVLFGYLFVWSGSLWVPIFAHFLNNASAFIFYYLKQEKHIDFDPDRIGVEGDGILMSIFISIVFTALFIYLFYANRKRELTN